MRIKNWERFQHYHSGRGAPPWVKLYRDLLNDKEWFALNPAASKFLVSCWLLAAESNGELPDIETIAFRLRLASKDVTKHITDCSHWIISDDINVLASCYRVATPETDTETETETDSLSGKPDVSHPKLNGSKAVAIELLDFLNAKAGKAYRPVVANLEPIVARLKEGFTPQDVKTVIARKCRDWGADDKMREYLRPATLFNRTKFAQYHGECVEA